MSDMHHFRAYLVQQPSKRAVHRSVTVPVPRPCHVDHMKSDTWIGSIGLTMRGVFPQEQILLPREDMGFVTFRKRMRQALRIHLRTRVVPHWVAMYDLEDSQYSHCSMGLLLIPWIVCLARLEVRRLSSRQHQSKSVGRVDWLSLRQSALGLDRLP